MNVKDLTVVLIDSQSANRFIRRHHYSGKIVNNSNLHFGVMDGKNLRGVMSFGCPMDKNRAIRAVKDTKWGGMLELNRMAFAQELPRNSESRCLAIALRIIKQRYPHVKWIQTYADACQCGDGTIYRACGFLLVSVKKNTTILRMASGEIIADKTLNDVRVNGKYLLSTIRAKKSLDNHRVDGKYLSSVADFEPLPGFQIKYIKFLDESKRKDLQLKVLDYSEIEKAGAKMYKGVPSLSSKTTGHQPEDSGAIPTGTLQ